MFHSARLQLTGWYLLIIMCISIAFSMVIYRFLMLEVQRFSAIQRFRIEQKLQESLGYIPSTPGRRIILTTDPDLEEEVRTRIIVTLAVVNGGILIISGILGYMLAGRTLRPIQDMMDEQNRFITDASHELRTPLTALKSAMEVHLRDKRLTLREAKTLIASNLDDVNKLQALSEGLLQLAQYQQPNGQTQQERVQLQDVLSQVIQKITPLAAAKQVTISSGKLEYTVPGDRYALEELFLIILDNAVKYSHPHGLVTVRAKKNDGSVILSINDQGVGIAAADLPHIFDRFYRADVARSKTDTSGYGLGLAIARKIVDRHHGTITAESTADKGTTFVIRLPTAHAS